MFDNVGSTSLLSDDQQWKPWESNVSLIEANGGGSKVGSVFHLSEVNKMSTRNTWGIGLMMKYSENYGLP